MHIAMSLPAMSLLYSNASVSLCKLPSKIPCAWPNRSALISNPDLFKLTSNKLKKINQELKEAEQKWLELEIKSEKLELDIS